MGLGEEKVLYGVPSDLSISVHIPTNRWYNRVEDIMKSTEIAKGPRRTIIPAPAPYKGPSVKAYASVIAIGTAIAVLGSLINLKVR